MTQIGAIGGNQSREDFMSKLASLGIPSEIITQGPDAVKSYAEGKGITLPAPPEKPVFGENGNKMEKPSLEEITKEFESLGIPAEVVEQGPQAVKEYAEANGIDIPQGPSKDEAKGVEGEPKEPPAEMKQELEALGVPADVISQGKEAVMQYAQENGITLPKPSEPPQEVGSRLDISF